MISLKRLNGSLDTMNRSTVGDLNVRLDRDNDLNARQITDLFDAFGFVICNAQLTHVFGELLDVAATCQDKPSPCVATY